MNVLTSCTMVSSSCLASITSQGAFSVLVSSMVFLKNFLSNPLEPMWSSVRNVGDDDFFLANIPATSSSSSSLMSRKTLTRITPL